MTGRLEGVTGGDWPEPLVCDRVEDLAGMVSRAAFNEARTHRYLLARSWQPDLPVMTWIMLNPSTADAFADDPTIRRCAGFARREGCGGIKVVNLFALRATDPGELRRHPDPVGPCNDRIIDAHACGIVVVAWGAHGKYAERSSTVARILLGAGVVPACLGVTAGDQPRHPLYVRGDAPLVPWQPVPSTGVRAMTSRPEDSQPGGVPPSAGLGQGSAAIPPSQAAVARDAVSIAPGGIAGAPQDPASGAAHPVVPLAARPAPGRSQLAGAGCGKVEPPIAAPSRTALTAAGYGSQGTPSRSARREGTAGPESATSGPAQSSPPPRKGRGGGDRAPVSGASGPGAAGTGQETAGGAPEASSALPAGKRGQDFRDAVKAAQSAQAAQRRRDRGKWPARRTGGTYGPGMSRRQPPGGAT